MIHSSYFYIFLLGVLTLQACKPQSSNTGTDQSQTSSNSNTSGQAVWFDNFNEAQAQAIKENRPILVNFTDSDTCGLCGKLNANIFSTPIFTDWAASHVILLEIDFSAKNQLPQEYIEQHMAMARSLKVNTYPVVWVLSITHEPENDRFKVKPMGKIGYLETPEEFLGALSNLVRFSKK